MGVYIKGMGKPKCCGLCDLYVAPSGTCPATKNTDKTERFSKAHRELEDDMWECTPEWCPLVEVKEPHGRLIDADFEEAHYTSMTTKPTPDVSQKDKENSLIIVKALQMARTVIEREGK